MPRTTIPGQCVSVCAACGSRVVAEIPRHRPFITHDADCPREGWPVLDAIEYADGPETATLDNWVDRR
jgi:hypothetical protein